MACDGVSFFFPNQVCFIIETARIPIHPPKPIHTNHPRQPPLHPHWHHQAEGRDLTEGDQHVLIDFQSQASDRAQENLGAVCVIGIACCRFGGWFLRVECVCGVCLWLWLFTRGSA